MLADLRVEAAHVVRRRVVRPLAGRHRPLGRDVA
nr:MAG TPA: hypothetical protein [Caudoviricetes sp.]